MPENAVKRTEIRYDRGELTVHKDQSGFRRYAVKFARVGVFPYVNQDGSISMEAKLPEELFSKVTIDSAKGAPVTEDHVPLSDSKGLVTPKNYQKYVKGTLGDDITVQDGHLCGFETVFDPDLMAKHDLGEKVEVSIGFELDIDPTAGELNGVKFDKIQRNMRINHVAHVDKGRAGDTVRVQLDSVPKDINLAIMKGELMPKDVQQDGTTAAATTEVGMLDKLLKLFGRRDSADPAAAAKPDPAAPAVGKGADEETAKKIADLEAKLKEALAKIAELTKPAEAATDAATLDSKIALRSALLDAAKIIVPDVKTDGMSDRDLKLKIIAAKLPFDQGIRQDASLSDVRIDAQFEAAVQMARKEAADGGIGIDASQVRSDEQAIADGKKARAGAWDEAEKARAKK